MPSSSSFPTWLRVVLFALLGLVAWKVLHAPSPSSPPPPAAGTPDRPGAMSQPVDAARPASTPHAVDATASARYPAYLPPEAIDTLRRIERGGPYPHRQDDSTFGNREGRLPPQPRGYYREYTVETPGSRDRGARRIIAGGQPPVEFFYTDDHYRSFRRFTVDGVSADTTETAR